MSPDGPTAAEPARCPRCGKPNACALAQPAAERPARCWCVDRKFPPGLLAETPPTACICAACLDAAES